MGNGVGYLVGLRELVGTVVIVAVGLIEEILLFNFVGEIVIVGLFEGSFDGDFDLRGANERKVMNCVGFLLGRGDFEVEGEIVGRVGLTVSLTVGFLL